MIGSSKNNRENYPRKSFWTQEKDTRVKRLSAFEQLSLSTLLWYRCILSSHLCGSINRSGKNKCLMALCKVTDLFISCIHHTSLPRTRSSRSPPQSVCVEGTRNKALGKSAWKASIRQVHCIHTSPYYFLLHVLSIETVFFF